MSIEKYQKLFFIVNRWLDNPVGIYEPPEQMG